LRFPRKKTIQYTVINYQPHRFAFHTNGTIAQIIIRAVNATVVKINMHKAQPLIYSIPPFASKNARENACCARLWNHYLSGIGGILNLSQHLASTS